MIGKAHALARDELIRVLTSYTGITTADGLAGGTTVVDANLIGRNDFIKDKGILIISGNARDEALWATSFNNVTGVITVATGFSAQILSGTIFKVVNIPPGSSIIAILTTVTNVFNLVNAMLTLTETGGTITATGLLTEDNVYINNAPAGEYYPRKVVIDLSDLAGGEVATIRKYYRIKSTGALELKGAPTIFAGVQAEPLKNVDLEPNRFGVQVTVEATIGVVIDWGVHYSV